MTPATAAAMRASLETRLVQQGGPTGMSPGRLRRRLVFQRVLRRLGEADTADHWILKGGYLLESRLASGARTTRDLDIATALTGDLDALRDALDLALAAVPDVDFFRFETTGVTVLRPDSAGRPGWRFSLTASVAGRPFDLIRVDIADRADETLGATTLFELTCPIRGLPFGPARVHAVDIAQHAAEKFHAISRTYAGDRPSTRVKDLVDIVLMAEAGLLPDPRLGERLQAVFASRDGAGLPIRLPDPPAAWRDGYRKLTAELQPVATQLDAAFAVANAIFQRAVTDGRDM